MPEYLRRPALQQKREEREVGRVAPLERLLSLDALRGFDMFWIVGADGLVAGLKKLGGGSIVATLAGQLEHKRWEGIACEDLIFPLFVFLSGVSMVFSLGKSLAQQGRWATVKKLFWRALLLYAVGVLFYGGMSKGLNNVRWVGVLQRIAISYFFAGLIFCFCDWRGRLAALLALLGGYWAIMTFIPVPGIGAGNFDEGKNLANYIDKMYLPGRRWDGDHDPEGILSNIPAIATCLLGVFAGMLLKSDRSGRSKAAWLALGGGVLIALGYAWSMQFPIIKKIWTSSYVLVAGGWAALLSSAFYFPIDVCKFQFWARPFVWIGTNALAIYVLHSVISFDGLARRFMGGEIAVQLGGAALLVQALMALLLTLCVARFLFKRKVFVRL